MEDGKYHLIECFGCGKNFRFGPHVYDGKYIRRYEVSVCRACYGSNWDGWNPGTERKLLAHLEKKGLPVPERNEKGWLPRD